MAATSAPPVGRRGRQATPFVLFGPPGTGKTTTLVEAIWQVGDGSPRLVLSCGSTLFRVRCAQVAFKGAPQRVLVVAPTNTAADLITERLAKLVRSACSARLQEAARPG